MKTKYRFIHFVKTHLPQTKKVAYRCFKNSPEETDLDIIRWHPPLQCFCFIPESFTGFTRGHLDDIAHFIGQL